MHDFYSIALKKNLDVKMIYGQQEYDFDEGLMSFLAPNQVLNIVVENQTTNSNREGWLLFIHKDFIWNTSLATKIKTYDFFQYAINEALFLSNEEQQIINTVFQNIKLLRTVLQPTVHYQKEGQPSNIESIGSYFT